MQASSRSNVLLRRPVAEQSIPDAWDDDEEEEEDNQKIWEDAYVEPFNLLQNRPIAELISLLSSFCSARNARAPMPELVISSSSTTSTVIPPPVSAFQTPMRILKRPSASTNSNTNSSASQGASGQTLAEREARYQAARERIFGGDDGSGSNVTLSDNGNGKSKRGGGIPGASSQTQIGNVLRQPLGPEADGSKASEVGHAPKGFKRRSINEPLRSRSGTTVPRST